MAEKFGVGSYLMRWLFAAALVFGTYNPTAYSWISWVLDSESSFGPVPAIIGVLLLIGWVIYLRATFMSMGLLGVALGTTLFACIIWLFIDLGVLSLDSTSALSWLALLLVSLLLATGMSWSHLRRRWSGQLDVDDVED